jgi:hypothetical protein
LRIAPTAMGLACYGRTITILGLVILGIGVPQIEAAADSLSVPNGSFELPTTAFVSTFVNSWEKAPKPDWYDESGPFLWDQLVGVFLNTATNSPDHIDNCDGAQAAYLFAVPEVAIWQDFDSVDWQTNVPTHAFDVTFEAGTAYQFTLGVIGGGGGMSPGATLELDVYYNDAATNQVPVATFVVTNSTDIFSNTTHLIDFTVSVPTVRWTDAWVGQHLGLRLLSTVSSNLAAGYWDVDNVRLTSQPLKLSNPQVVAGQLQLTLSGEAGLACEIEASEAPLGEAWVPLGIVTNEGGATTFPAGPVAAFASRFFRARALP